MVFFFNLFPSHRKVPTRDRRDARRPGRRRPLRDRSGRRLRAWFADEFSGRNVSYTPTPEVREKEKRKNMYSCSLSVPTTNGWHAKWKLGRNTHTLHATFSHVWPRFCILRRSLLTKFLPRSSVGSLLKSALLVGMSEMWPDETNGSCCLVGGPLWHFFLCGGVVRLI